MHPDFWTINEQCLRAGLSTNKPRCAVQLPVDDHWLLEEMAVSSTLRYYQDQAYRLDVHREVNDRLERAVSLRPFAEREAPFPAPRRVEELLGSRMEVIEGGTPWLEPGFSNPTDLDRHLRTVADWSDDDLDRELFADGRDVEPGGTYAAWSRGPTTMLTSVVGAETAVWWCLDETEVIERFYRVTGELIVRVQRRLAGRRGGAVAGLAWLDDHCALLNPELYRRFALPTMLRAFDELAPNPSDLRFQHSDSDMAHLLPCLAEYGLHAVNLGPRISAATIREALPGAVVHGQIPPFMLRNEPWQVVEAQVRRDFDEAGRDGALVVTTAGSVAAGTTVERLRRLVDLVEEACAYPA